jgi:hypothetical protein
MVSDYDLIALDLDGTLLDSNERISPRNRTAIAAALLEGVRVVLVTGRGVDTPATIVRELGLDVPVICAHGALTKDVVTGKVLGHIPVPLQSAKVMMEYAEANALTLAVYSNERFYRLEDQVLFMEDMNGPNWTALPSFREILGIAPTFMRFLGERSVEAMRTTFAHLRVHFKYETWGDFEECAVTNIDATKKNALLNLCKTLAIDSRRVLAIGDSRNDVPMLRWAGLGLAVANALPEVHEMIPHATASNDDDGVAVAIERYLLADRDRKSA